MNRALSFLVMAVLLILTFSGGAQAHSATQIAAVSTQGNQVTVRMVDVYGAPVEQVPVGVSATEPGTKPGKYAALKEALPGTYTGSVVPPKVEVYQLNLETTLGGEPYRGSLRVRVGEDLAEVLIPLAAVDGEGAGNQGLSWSTYLYIAVLIAVVTATVMAMLRKRPEGGEAE